MIDGHRWTPVLNEQKPKASRRSDMSSSFYLHFPNRFDVLFGDFCGNKIHQNSNLIDVLILINVSCKHERDALEIQPYRVFAHLPTLWKEWNFRWSIGWARRDEWKLSACCSSNFQSILRAKSEYDRRRCSVDAFTSFNEFIFALKFDDTIIFSNVVKCSCSTASRRFGQAKEKIFLIVDKSSKM